MSYLVLARKWRPQTFTDLVGQEHVTQTLRSALVQGRIAHAFLFTGARGVGKTTIARVLAKSLNCLSAPGPTPEPCAHCAACEEIARGNDVDVKEIDGASNNSVDDVRRLQESLPYVPARDRFKVVIIDEVHMLSAGAFNALLKTLEEPPPHVKFIFATTEVHKVPVTILSRCQRYDFKLIPTSKIRDHVEHILQTEKIEHDAAAVALVAREAAGSMRDALSLLDQVIAGVAGTVTGAQASKLLGVADRVVQYDLARAVLTGDAAAALQIVQRVSDEAYDLGAFARGFLSVLRDLVVAKIVPDPGELLDLADDERADVQHIAEAAERLDLERLFAAFSRTSDDLGRAREPRWVLEMALVRLAHRPALVALDDVLTRLADLERRLDGGPDTRGPAPAGGSSGTARPATTVRASSGTPSSGGSRAQASVEAVAGASTAVVASWRPRASRPPVSEVAETKPDRESLMPTRPSAPPAEPIDTRSVAGSLQRWGQVLAAMEAGPVAVLENAVALEVSAERVRLAYETGSFYARKVADPEVHEQIATAAERVLGGRPTVEIILGAIPADAPSLAREAEARRVAARAQREGLAREDPFVKRFIDLVGGEVRSVKLGDER